MTAYLRTLRKHHVASMEQKSSTSVRLMILDIKEVDCLYFQADIAFDNHIISLSYPTLIKNTLAVFDSSTPSVHLQLLFLGKSYIDNFATPLTHFPIDWSMSLFFGYNIDDLRRFVAGFQTLKTSVNVRGNSIRHSSTLDPNLPLFRPLFTSTNAS